MAVASIPVDSPLHGDRASLFTLVEAARERLDAVIVSAPPLSGSDLSQFLADHSDATVLVAESGTTLFSELRSGIEHLYRSPLPAFTSVLIGETPSLIQRLMNWRNASLEGDGTRNPVSFFRSLRRTSHHLHGKPGNKASKRDSKSFRAPENTEERNTEFHES